MPDLKATGEEVTAKMAKLHFDLLHDMEEEEAALAADLKEGAATFAESKDITIADLTKQAAVAAAADITNLQNYTATMIDVRCGGFSIAVAADIRAEVPAGGYRALFFLIPQPPPGPPTPDVDPTLPPAPPVLEPSPKVDPLPMPAEPADPIEEP